MHKASKAAALLRGTNFLMVAAVLIIGAATILWAERLTVNGGFGWDGLLYAAWAKDFYGAVFVAGLPEYYVQRVLPSGVVHYGLRLFGAPAGDGQIILAYSFYNLSLLVLSAYVWGLIADELRLRTAGKWLGFCFLFINYATLKHNFYGSLQTDTSAFALGVLMFYFFLRDRPAGLAAVIIVGGFVWPTVPQMAALLLVFPYRRGEGTAGEPLPAGDAPASRLNAPASRPSDAPASRPSWVRPGLVSWVKPGVVIAALVSGATLVTLLYLTSGRLAERAAYFGRALRIDYPLIALSVAAVIVYLFFSLRAAADDPRLFSPRRLLAAVSWPRAALAVLLLVGLKLITRALSSGEIMEWGSPKSFVMYTLLSSLTEPLIFLVAHVIYYGPAVLLLALCWRAFCESTRGFGVGFALLVIGNVLLSINPQSRYQINAAVIFWAPLALLLDRRGLRRRDVALWALLSLAFSKIWYTFNTAPQVDDGTMAALQNFPLQHLFMNIGPWMSRDMYLAQGCAVLLAGVLLYFAARHWWRDRPASEVAGGEAGAAAAGEFSGSSRPA